MREEKTKEPFWMVWNPENRAPRFKHETGQAALIEAERLAKENPGQEFVVLQAIRGVKTFEPVQHIKYEMPF